MKTFEVTLRFDAAVWVIRAIDKDGALDAMADQIQRLENDGVRIDRVEIEEVEE